MSNSILIAPRRCGKTSGALFRLESLLLASPPGTKVALLSFNYLAGRLAMERFTPSHPDAIKEPGLHRVLYPDNRVLYISGAIRGPVSHLAIDELDYHIDAPAVISTGTTYYVGTPGPKSRLMPLYKTHKDDPDWECECRYP